MGAVHARIPMMIPDEVRALQLEKAEEVEREWSALQGMVQARLAGHKELQVTIDREITQDEIAATDLGSNPCSSSIRDQSIATPIVIRKLLCARVSRC